MNDKLFEKAKVNLVACLDGNRFFEGLGPDDLPVFAALSCFEEKSALELFKENKEKLSEEAFEKLKEKIYDETSGRGHGSVLDQSRFTWVVEDLPRLVTFQLCLSQYAEHLQQSLRRAKADRAFYIPDTIRSSPFVNEVAELLAESFELYEKMADEGVPGEDARFVLPLLTKTNINTTGNAREMMHVHYMSTQEHMPSTAQDIVNVMMNQAKGAAPRLMKKRATSHEVRAWYPAPQLFSLENKLLEELVKTHGGADARPLGHSGSDLIDEKLMEKAVKEGDETYLANLKHTHFSFLTRMSLTSLHQAIRQRTWDQSVESIYNAAERGEFVIPKHVAKSEDYADSYNSMNGRMLGLYKKMVMKGIPKQEAIGVVPHSLVVYDLVHINGWNAIHSIAKRTCREAQWEIRKVARDMAYVINSISPALGLYAQPQGVVYPDGCPERENCGYCDGILKKRGEKK